MNDITRMNQAIAEAENAMVMCHPNPAVGALIVHRGEVVACGHTQAPGYAHAEIMALDAWSRLGLEVDGSTVLYVTLEPCSTQGRTGACTDAIVRSGIRRVVIGAIDPNPLHCGRGVELLTRAGLAVLSGVCSRACEDLNPVFNHWMRTGRPLIAAKVATTLDGRIATRGGQSKWITGVAARADVHRWRAAFPAIAVGAGTVRADDPALTVRRPGHAETAPVRFVFDRNLVTLREADPQIYRDPWRERTVVVSLRSRAARARQLEQERGIRFWLLDGDADDDGLGEFVSRCAQESITGVLVEGGAQLLSSFLKHRMLDYLLNYRAPIILADNSALPAFFGFEPSDMNAAIRLTDVRHQIFDPDQLMRGSIVYPPH